MSPAPVPVLFPEVVRQTKHAPRVKQCPEKKHSHIKKKICNMGSFMFLFFLSSAVSGDRNASINVLRTLLIW